MENMIEMPVSKLPSLLNVYRNTGENLFIWGPSGIGKSEVVRDWAEDVAAADGLTFFDVGGEDMPDENPASIYGFIDLRAVLLDALDVKGGPYMDVEQDMTRFLKASILPQIERHGAQGLLFLDELPQAFPSVTNGLSQLVYDRRIGDNYRLPPGWQIVAAGNRKADGAATQKLGSHMLNRFGHVEAKEDLDGFCSHLAKKNRSALVGAFLRSRPELLHDMPRNGTVFPTPRGWFRVAEFLENVDDKELRFNLCGTHVGMAGASELMSFCDMVSQLVTFEEIVRTPRVAAVPSMGSPQGVAASWAIVGMMSRRVDHDTMGNCIEYLRRMPEDMQPMFILDVRARDESLTENSAVSAWRRDNPDFSL